MTGVVFTRNPSDGTKNIYGEYLINAQGEDVVAGTRTHNILQKKLELRRNKKNCQWRKLCLQFIENLNKYY